MKQKYDVVKLTGKWGIW